MKIIQITDTHLFKDDSNKLFNVKTNNSFKKTISLLKENELTDTDAIFLTGDLSQDESTESYELLLNEFKDTNVNIYWIPGNHDDINAMEHVFSKQKLFIPGKKLITTKWDFVFINTNGINSDKGRLSDNELKHLALELENSKNKNTAVIMHHHPIEVSTPIVDEYILKNKDDFWKIISNHRVNIIICGHVHGDYSLKYKNTCIEASPATCFQWTKSSTELHLENKIGYKIYYFKSNGTYETETKLWDIYKNREEA